LHYNIISMTITFILCEQIMNIYVPFNTRKLSSLLPNFYMAAHFIILKRRSNEIRTCKAYLLENESFNTEDFLVVTKSFILSKIDYENSIQLIEYAKYDNYLIHSYNLSFFKLLHIVFGYSYKM
jgi:hypothetical protein